jgi:hypothetical protein
MHNPDNLLLMALTLLPRPDYTSVQVRKIFVKLRFGTPDHATAVSLYKT